MKGKKMIKIIATDYSHASDAVKMESINSESEKEREKKERNGKTKS